MSSVKLQRLQTILATNGQDGQLFVAKDGRAVPAGKLQKEGLFALRQVAPASYNAQLAQYNRGIEKLLREVEYDKRLADRKTTVIPSAIMKDFGPQAQNYVVFEDKQIRDE